MKRVACVPLVAVTFLFVSALACGNPSAFPSNRTEDELFYVEPEILEGVRPYVADWATLPPEDTLEQREEIGSELGVGISVDTSGPYTLVQIQIEVFHDWERDLLYVHEDVDLREVYGTRDIRFIEEHFYAYNSNY
jgi:hypothetical protein